MNSNYGKGGGSFDFDLGIGSGRPRSLNDQKNRTFSSTTTTTATAQPRPAWQPNRPAWTHQPAPSQAGLSGPTSMVGDIFGKSWGGAPSSGIGIVGKDPNLFGDLLGSALGGGGGGGKGYSVNAPLKDARPAAAPGGRTTGSSPYSMGGVADSLPKVGNSGQSGGIWGSGNVGVRGNVKSSNLGGPSIKGTGGIGGGGGGNRDPFGSLLNFGSKPKPVGVNSGSKVGEAKSNVDDGFGDFQNASGSGSSMPKQQQPPPPARSGGGDPLGGLFSGGAATSGSGSVDDWGEIGGGGVEDEGGAATTELDGLPPPPAGVSASAAKSKGLDHQKQGQYADAIKWLSWAVLLLEKAGDKSSTMETLSSRASCYKEVGEYKKAVADCSQVLEHDKEKVSVLVQRALLYESMEKYKLGAEDLRSVLRIDPANRLARSTVHRLTKMAE